MENPQEKDKDNPLPSLFWMWAFVAISPSCTKYCQKRWSQELGYRNSHIQKQLSQFAFQTFVCRTTEYVIAIYNSVLFLCFDNHVKYYCFFLHACILDVPR